MKTKVVKNPLRRAASKPPTGEAAFIETYCAHTRKSAQEAKDILQRLVYEAGDAQQAATRAGCTIPFPASRRVTEAKNAIQPYPRSSAPTRK